MVPNGWKRIALDNLAKTVTSGSRDWAQYYSQEGSKFIRMTNLQRDSIHLNLNDLKYVDVQSNSADGKRTSLKSGDILISITAELGKIGWVPEGLGEAFINQHIALVRLSPEKANSLFVAYLLSSSRMNKQINKLNDSGAKAGLNLPTIRRLHLPTPPLPEQKKIARILSTWDKAIETVDKLIENSKQQKKVLMQQLLTGKKRLPGFSGEWKEVWLKDIAKILVSNVDKKSNPKETPVMLCNYTDVYYNDYITGGINFMQATAKKSEIQKFQLKKGDVVITKDSETPGDIAIPTLVDEDINNLVCGYHLAIIRPRLKLAFGDFLAALFSMPETRYYFFTLANGATRFGLNISSIQNAKFYVPNVEEQRAISVRIRALNDIIASYAMHRDNIASQKQALMQQLLTGKRRVKIDDDRSLAQAG